ncbi:hypothetical protein CMI37_18315 [Candidatus Pacearchaeota archaeon]|nr:hypothetical protein [Candidatus Pacearchaeota archaeon]
MHRARHEIEINQIGGLSAELAGIFDRAERKLYKERGKFFKGLSTNAQGEIIGSVKNIEAARKRISYVKDSVDKLVKKPGMVWGDKMVKAMGEAGRELARVNLTTDFIPQAKIDAVFKHISSTERAILKVGRYDAYSIIGTIGDDINEFFRREMLDSVAEGIPIQGRGDTLANRLFASGRLKAIPVYTKDGRTIMRSARTRADAIARVESAKILNATHEDVTKQALGDEAVYRNSNPRDSRTTDICLQASRQEPMTLLEWSRTRFGRPPRLRPFHLCRSVLIGGMKEWFEDDGNPEPVQNATKPPQPDNPKIKGPQDFDSIEDRLKYYTEGDSMVRDLIAEGARRKREYRKLSKEYDRLAKEGNILFDQKDRGTITKEQFYMQFGEVDTRKTKVFRQMDMSEDWQKEYVAKLVGNSDEILVKGLPLRDKWREIWEGFGSVSAEAIENLKYAGSAVVNQGRLDKGRDFVDRLMHLGKSDLDRDVVVSRKKTRDYAAARKALDKNLDDGFINKSHYDLENAYIDELEQKLVVLREDLGPTALGDSVEIVKYERLKTIDYDLTVSKLPNNRKARAFQWDYSDADQLIDGGRKRGVVLVDADSAIKTVVHELGHLVEWNVAGVQKAAQKFLAYRVRGETAVGLKKVFPTWNFKPYETGRKDKFREVWYRFWKKKKYGGRRESSLTEDQRLDLNERADVNAYYEGKEYAQSTEIVSMGMELMYEDAVLFARYDPEYFKFIVGILRGDLRYY